ncbi:MAG TPA: UvrB/UvrC motif-containing protein [Opitutales bacterium]|nr:UvrB/UvrC motif-containing protein [Opitutales bacterium]
MAKSLKCNLCDEPATVHLTQIVNNKVHKVDLCESCAQSKGVTDPNGFSLADLLVKSPFAREQIPGQLQCSTCGFKQSDFRKLGRLGCPDCYTVFGPILTPVLKNMHKGLTHVGKVPEKSAARYTIREQLAALEEEIQSAIESERYEDAAKIRDKINHLKKSSAKSRS